MKVIEVDNTGIQKYCGKCGKPHYLLKFDGQVMQIGNVQIYNSVRYSCAGCGFPATFFASPIKDDRKGFDDKTKAILNSLGFKRKRAILRQSNENKNGD
jgi:ribosomal protein L37E